MKLLCKSLVLYLLVLTLMPCTDIHASQVAISSSTTSASTHSECPHETDKDFCSPFCICSCCGQSVFLNAHGKIGTEKHILEGLETKNLFAYIPSVQSDYLDRLFHPPKV